MIIPVNKGFNPDGLFYKGDKTYASKGFRGLNFAGKLKFASILLSATGKCNTFHKKTLTEKQCYIGPFWGEFGNFLLHYLPYVSYLHKNGVKPTLCCLENYLPFLVDENGENIYKDCYVLRDFFKEVRPSANRVDPPDDVKQKYLEFKESATKSGLPFLDLSDADLYWYIYRNWQLKGRQYAYHLEKVYGKNANTKQHNAVIFPRKKSAGYTPNNGEGWDYMALAKLISPYFDNVFITGHPLMSSEVHAEGNIHPCLSADNKIVLETCANASLIITQHSGAMHVGSYLNIPVLLIFKGKLPVKGLDDSDRFAVNIKRQDVHIAFNENEITDFVKNLKSK